MVARGITLMVFAVLMPGGAVAQSVAEVQVAPPSVTIKVGERAALLATAFDRAGNVIPTVTFIWSSNNLAVAKIGNEGTVTAVGGGVALIEARVGARRGQAAVQVIASQLPPVSGAPPPASQQPPAEPVAPAADGLAGQPPGTGPASVLRIEPPTVYLLPSENTRVSLTGVVTAVAPGRTTLLVSGLLQSKVIDVVVHKSVAELRVSPSFKQEVPLPIGGTATFQVQALAGDQTLVPEAPLRWTV